MFDILHILDKSLITLWRWVMIHSCEGEAYVFSRAVHATRDVVAIEINYTKVANTDTTITLRSNWSCLSQRIWFQFGEGNATSVRVISAEGHDFELLAKPSKSYLNRRDVNWCRQVE